VQSKQSRHPKRKPAREVFGIALREAREGLGYSQERLALEAGINRTYVSDIERGARNIAIDNLERLADAVGKPLWEMLRP
jgi:transcriptional regulator with XRE-family HTH domain